MRKIAIWGVVALMAVAIAAVPALATTTFNSNTAPSGAHYRSGFAEPVCTSSTAANGAITVSCTNTTIGGVGNTPANLLLTVNATANFTCSNPGSKRMVVEPHSGSATDSDAATLTPSRNGQLIVDSRSVTISPADAAAQFECPNPNWRENFVGFSGGTFTYSLTFVGFSQPAILINGTL